MELEWGKEKQELFYCLPQEEKDTMVSVKMIEHNRIPGLLPMYRQYVDEQIQYIYEIQGCHALQDVLGIQPVSVSWVCRVLSQVLETISVGETFLLHMQEYYISSQTIYFDRSKEHVLVCYTPGVQHDLHQDFRELMETLLEHMDHRNKKEIELFYGIYDMHCAGEVTLAEMQEHFVRCGKKMLQIEDSSCGHSKDVTASRTGQKEKTGKQPAEQESKFAFVYMKKRKLWNKKSYDLDILPEQFELQKGRFSVGRRHDQAFLLLPQQISREHAVLEVGQEQVYLTDCGSSNGTYVNDRKISAHVKTRLKVGDVITFADISYQLKGY